MSRRSVELRAETENTPHSRMRNSSLLDSEYLSGKRDRGAGELGGNLSVNIRTSEPKKISQTVKSLLRSDSVGVFRGERILLDYL